MDEVGEEEGPGGEYEDPAESGESQVGTANG